ncbi:Peptidase C1A papain C-terminal domain-containing protein [Caenorhabditis elegans]|uniref:Peptidase C1A papain C-terminal domain-containing protein n=1 Tax=Caenorhabditis elegans TaxID=6239 RepID=Q9BL26_CAEEL|nr:Peptidase C1A papain C-terminal domain-containing protein [Caenorhabditis elegans]CCD72484.2 Peptidase C1A papain C-terminal domain-containing protein [Caenorhabditis elegans]
MVSATKLSSKADEAKKQKVFVAMGEDLFEKPANSRSTFNSIILFTLTALTFYIIGSLVQQRTSESLPTRFQWETPIHMDRTTEEFLDWREKGIVGPVKDQGKCNASHAFAITSSIESMYAKATNGTLLSFSEQQLIDCNDQGYKGCEEQFAMNAIGYLATHGIETEADYPYVDKTNEKCTFDSTKSKIHLKKGVVAEGNEVLGKVYVTNYGPAFFTMRAPPSLYDYKIGIYNPSIEECTSTHEIRSMVIVGYGIEGEQKYWIVKGSFGTSWGEQGYMKLARDVNACAMATTIAVLTEFV